MNDRKRTDELVRIFNTYAILETGPKMCNEKAQNHRFEPLKSYPHGIINIHSMNNFDKYDYIITCSIRRFCDFRGCVAIK